MIYKIFRQTEWDAFRAAGQTRGAPIDIADGFIHFSTATQLRGTLDKHFAGVAELWLAALAAESLGDALKWEVSRGGALFPHLYRPLALDEIRWCRPIPLGRSGHELPDNLA